MQLSQQQKRVKTSHHNWYLMTINMWPQWPQLDIMCADLIWRLRLYCGKILSGLVKLHTRRLPNLQASLHTESQLFAAPFHCFFCCLWLSASCVHKKKKTALPLRIFLAFLLCKIRQLPLLFLSQREKKATLLAFPSFYGLISCQFLYFFLPISVVFSVIL